MKSKFIFLILLLAGLLTGCQQAPEEVLERMDSHGKNNQVAKVQYELCSIAELRQASMEDIKEMPQNLLLPEQVDFSDVESVELVTFQRNEDCMKNRERIAGMFQIQNPEWEIVEGEGKWSESSSDAGRYYLAVDENGSVSYIGGEEHDDLVSDIWPDTVKQIHLNRGESTDMECVLQGKKVSLQEQLGWVQSWVDNCEILGDEFDYKIQRVYIKEKADGDNRIAVLFQEMYKGVGLDYLALELGDADGKTIVTQMGAEVGIEIDQEKQLSYFLNETSVHVKESKPVEQVVDFPSAVKLAEQHLSGFSKLRVEEIRLEYMLYPVYDYENENYETAGILIETRPVYSFWIKSGEVHNQEIGIVETNDFVRVNVDLVDGTVDTDFEDKGFKGQ